MRSQQRWRAVTTTTGLAVVLTAALPALAEEVSLSMTLDGMQETPISDTPATGTGTATLDTDTLLLTWHLEFADLLGTQSAAHFHGPAAYCESGGVQITLPVGSPIDGQQTVSSQQAADILAGLWYVNVHTSSFPGGEIRGQVMPAILSDPIPEPIEVGGIDARLETLASGLTAPNWATGAPGDARLFVVDQPGIVWAINTADGTRSIFLDVSGRLVSLGAFGQDTFDERGLLGLAFHPDYQNNGLLYTYTSEPADRVADFSTIPPEQVANHQSVILEWTVLNPSDPDSTVDPSSARELFRIDEPQFNHNGGCLNFGPDGLLYISVGDGGGADDQDGQEFVDGPMFGHGCRGNGQNLDSALGKMLRVDPLGRNSVNGNYGIPADNPFNGRNGLDEIFAYGLRNPFRFSFDSVSGTLLAADVGQNHIEEVNIITSGGNYGWSYKEGSFWFVPNGHLSGYVTDRPLDSPPNLVDPIAQYDHNEGISVIGGFVYRGTALPAMQGRYVFGEFGPTFDNDGRLFYLTDTNAIKSVNVGGQDTIGMFLLGLGQDNDGEMYVLANTTAIPFGDTGVVMRLVPSLDLELSGDCPGQMTATASRATPDGVVAFVRAFGTGSVTIPGGFVCAGTLLGLDASAALIQTVRADAGGVAQIVGPVPGAACGGRVLIQALDVSSCLTSGVAATP
ncbi:MAG: CHRD domain-containing protein [Planctomycetes bacterium]|nr:CHRD domain-containing protein [Planctomycetota bacterium]